MFPEKSKIPYTIEISSTSFYPFNLSKPAKFRATVRVKIEIQQQTETHQKIMKICALNHPNLVQILQVFESHRQKHYELVYQYIPYPISHPCQLFQRILKEKKYYSKLKQLIQELVRQGVRPKPQISDFGFTDEGELKFYLRPGFQFLDKTISEQNRKGVVNDIFQCCEDLFQKMHTKNEGKIQFGLRSKIQHLQGKIKRIRDNFLKKKENFQSLGQKNQSSEESEPQIKTPSIQAKPKSRYSGGQREEVDRNFEESLSCRDGRKEKKRTSSFKLVEKKAKSESKHKLSWQAKTEVAQEDSDKSTVLQNRISLALHKTQKTLTKYQKVRGKGRKRKR